MNEEKTTVLKLTKGSTMKGLIATLGVALALIAGNLTLTSATASNGSHDDHRKTLHLVSKTVDGADLDFNEEGFGLGDQFVFTDNVFKNNKRVGELHGWCALARETGTGADARSTLECQATLVLAAGQITLQGAPSFTEEGPQINTVAITGGTGAYKTAHGQVRVREVSETEAELTVQLILND